MNALTGVGSLARSASWRKKIQGGKEGGEVSSKRMVSQLVEEPGEPQRVVYVFEGGVEELGEEDDE